jgi:hypothetical protein
MTLNKIIFLSVSQLTQQGRVSNEIRWLDLMAWEEIMATTESFAVIQGSRLHRIIRKARI